MKKLVIASLCFASCTAMADPMSLSFCSGSQRGGNFAIAANAISNIQKMDKQQQVKIQNTVTAGTKANLEGFNAGECNLAVVQADGLQDYAPTVPYRAKAANDQVMFWMYNKQYNKTDLSDLRSSDEYAIVIVRDSGMQITMRNFALADRDGYGKLYKNAVYEDDFYDAMNDVADGYVKNDKGQKVKVAGTLFITMPGYIDFDTVMDFNDKVAVGELDASLFSSVKDVNGDELYRNCKFSKDQVKGFDTSNSLMDQQTVCVSSMIIYPQSTGDQKVDQVLKRGINRSVRSE